MAGIALSLVALSAPAVAETIGLPSDHFVSTWTALPAGHFVPARPSAPVTLLASTAIVDDAAVDRAVAAAIASAADDGDRRDIAIYEMATGWDQPQRTALETLRASQRAFAATSGGPDDGFVAMLGRAADGSGRSIATDGKATETALDEAYKAALTAAGDTVRTKLEAEQNAWVAYRDAFVAFAEAKTPGTAGSVRDELTRRRTAELSAH